MGILFARALEMGIVTQRARCKSASFSSFAHLVRLAFHSFASSSRVLHNEPLRKVDVPFKEARRDLLEILPRVWQPSRDRIDWLRKPSFLSSL